MSRKLIDDQRMIGPLADYKLDLTGIKGLHLYFNDNEIRKFTPIGIDRGQFKTIVEVLLDKEKSGLSIAIFSTGSSATFFSVIKGKEYDEKRSDWDIGIICWDYPDYNYSTPFSGKEVSFWLKGLLS